MQPSSTPAVAVVVGRNDTGPVINKATLGLGISQVISGIIAMALGAGGLMLKSHPSHIGPGLWCGVLFLLSGSFTMKSSLKRTHCYIITSMVLSIISSAVSGCVLLGMAINAAIYDADQCHYDYLECYHRQLPITGGRIAVSSVLAIVAVAETVFGIVTSALCCRAVCCGRPQGNPVYYFSNQQQIQLTGVQMMPTNLANMQTSQLPVGIAGQGPPMYAQQQPTNIPLAGQPQPQAVQWYPIPQAVITVGVPQPQLQHVAPNQQPLPQPNPGNGAEQQQQSTDNTKVSDDPPSYPSSSGQDDIQASLIDNEVFGLPSTT